MAAFAACLAYVCGLVAKRGFGAVEVPLASILLHPAQDMLGDFLALIFVKEHEDMPLHIAAGGHSVSAALFPGSYIACRPA